MSLRSSGRRLLRVTMLQYAPPFRSLPIDESGENMFPVGCLNIPILDPCCSNFMTATDSFLILLCALAELKVLLQKAKKITKREPSRQAPDGIGVKLLITSTALRANRNRHLGTVMLCSEASKPIQECFETSSFWLYRFPETSQIIANLTRETLAECEAEITNLLQHWQKDTSLARCRGGQGVWRYMKLVISQCYHGWRGPSLGKWRWIRKKTEYRRTIVQASEEGPRHHQHEDFSICPTSWWWHQLDYWWGLSLLTSLHYKLAPGPDGIHNCVYRCAGWFWFEVPL